MCLVGCGVDPQYPADVPKTIDVTKWYDTDSALKGCKVYYMHGSKGTLSFSFDQYSPIPSELYFMKCKDGTAALSSFMVVQKSTNNSGN